MAEMIKNSILRANIQGRIHINLMPLQLRLFVVQDRVQMYVIQFLHNSIKFKYVLPRPIDEAIPRPTHQIANLDT